MKIIKGLPNRELKDGEPVALDVEIFGMKKGRIHRTEGDFACLSAAIGNSVYQVYDTHDIPYMLERLNKGLWIFHNAMFDLRQLRRWADITPRLIWDTMLVEQGLFGGYYSSFSLADLSVRYLHQYMEKEARDEFVTATEMDQKMIDYAAQDVVSTLAIYKEQKKYIEASGEPMKHYEQSDAPAVWSFLDFKPMRIDVDAWVNLVKGIQVKADAVCSQLDFNPRSYDQVKSVLIGMTRKRVPDTNEKTLTSLREECHREGKAKVVELIDKILLARGYLKAVSTYGLAWIDKYVEPDGYVYSSFKIDGTETARPSSSDPNIANIPARENPEYREAFICSPGCEMSVWDVSAQEPRVLAYLSKDEALLAGLRSGTSVHLAVAREVFGDPTITKKDAEKYFIGKKLNLGMSYGMSEIGLAQQLNCTEDEARVYIDAYFKKFSGVRNYIETYRHKAWSSGYVRNPIGRRIWINPHVNKWRNNAINGPIQSGAADMTKLAINFMWRECRRENIAFPVCNSVYDELVCDVELENVEKVKAIETEAWKYAIDNVCPGIGIEVEKFYGKNWGCKK